MLQLQQSWNILESYPRIIIVLPFILTEELLLYPDLR